MNGRKLHQRVLLRIKWMMLRRKHDWSSCDQHQQQCRFETEFREVDTVFMDCIIICVCFLFLNLCFYVASYPFWYLNWSDTVRMRNQWFTKFYWFKTQNKWINSSNSFILSFSKVSYITSIHEVALVTTNRIITRSVFSSEVMMLGDDLAIWTWSVLPFRHK